MGKYFIPRVKFRQPTDRTIEIKCMRMEKMMELTLRKKLSPMLIYVRKSSRARDSALIDYLNNTSRCIMQVVQSVIISFTIHSLARNIRRDIGARVNLIMVIICFTDNKTAISLSNIQALYYVEAKQSGLFIKSITTYHIHTHTHTKPTVSSPNNYIDCYEH